MTPRAIRVRIDTLVLEGVAAADRLQVGAALELELARLLQTGGLPTALAQGGAQEALDAGTFAHPAQATPRAVGRSVARSVYAGLKGRDE